MIESTRLSRTRLFARWRSRSTAAVAALTLCAIAAGCGAPLAGDPEPIERSGAAGEAFDLRPRFRQLHASYRAASAEYTQLLRATLRHARRVPPEECVAYQRQLIEVGAELGFDGLEPLWLVYQDGAAHGTEATIGEARRANAALLHGQLRFAAAPLGQLALRVSHWDSAIERGVRGDAARALLVQASQAGATIAASGLHRLLGGAKVRDALCGLSVRVDQRGGVAVSELFRVAGCTMGLGVGPADVCGEVGKTAPGAAIPGLSSRDSDRLRELCNQMSSDGTAGNAGIDMLDGYATDQCAGEDAQLAAAAGIPDQIMDCYYPDSSNPVADGETSADIGRIMNRPFTYPRGSTPEDGYGAALMVGPPDHGEGTKFYGAQGATPEEALANLPDAVASDPPPGTTATSEPDGSTTVEGERDVVNADGSTSHVRDSATISADGALNASRTTENADGSGSYEQETTNPDGSGSSLEFNWDEHGNVESMTQTETNEDGETTTTDTTYHYDDDGELIDTEVETSTSADPGMEGGGFDPSNPACQELVELGITPGSSGSAFWTGALKREHHLDPRLVNPVPDGIGGEWTEEPFCGAPAIGSNTLSKCNLPVMCTADTVLNDACQCVQPANTRQLPERGCATTTCPDGAVAVPVGPNACSCVSPDSSEPGRPPIPLPDLAQFNAAFGEQIWNRPDGTLFITRDMADRSKLP